MRPECVRSQGRAGECGAQPRQVAGRHGLRGPSAAAMPAPRISPKPPFTKRCRRPTTLRASPQKTRLPPCQMPKTSRQPSKQRTDLDLFFPWAIDSAQAAQLALVAEAAALNVGQAHHQQRGRQRVGPAIAFFQRPHHMVFGAATPVRAMACRSRRLPARAMTCSATPGTAPCAAPMTWPRRRPWGATPQSGR